MSHASSAPALPGEPTRDGLPPMPPGPAHEESHFASLAPLRDLLSGAADGLVLPFAVTAALAALGVAPAPILLSGLAVAAAGAVSAGLGHAMAARREAAHYLAERAREEEESRLYPERERWEVAAILHRYGLRGDLLRQAVEAIAGDRRRWVDFMMRFELDLSEPDPRQAARSALALGLGQALGGLLPLLPYLLAAAPADALVASAGLTAAGLLGLGGLKARASGLPPMGGALQALALGLLSGMAAWMAAAALG
ncbi:VIT1/CCC1 transporter family protein [Falsiroseomonas tokyonensis]|uniref:VIT1/CCC1 transporter family protein n=1 Tax=Falsiroseomonas tokyonensis TaxID=430521 RepID=A0ABV7BTM0_9PROT|nr:VIT1/CCC1 transporter family protein [Falsiroseomonas tokyonensis]MBU8537423.1 VIT1/CCC1 transporter family protein [Falsiroseomonas tokyonensis]